jgi:cytochrome c
MKSMFRVLAVLALATPAFADSHDAGDADAGAKTFGKCKSCHMISNGDEVIEKGGRTGPNLYGVIGRQAGTVEGFKYQKALVAAGEAGLIWDQALLTEYVADPREFLREFLDDSKAKSGMVFKLKKGGADVAAYLARVGPEAAPAEAPADSDS